MIFHFPFFLIDDLRTNNINFDEVLKMLCHYHVACASHLYI